MLYKVGSSGASVARIQRKLGITADGLFGSKTKAAVIKFQKIKRVRADGVVGWQTWILLGLSNGKRHSIFELKCKDGTFPLSAQIKYAKAGTIYAAEKIEDKTGVKVKFNSGYRSWSYNRKVGGASLSEHINKVIGGCTAIDIAPVSGKKSDVEKIYNYTKKLQSAGVIKGVGRYSTFVHIDKRRGAKATW